MSSPFFTAMDLTGRGEMAFCPPEGDAPTLPNPGPTGCVVSSATELIFLCDPLQLLALEIFTEQLILSHYNCPRSFSLLFSFCLFSFLKFQIQPPKHCLGPKIQGLKPLYRMSATFFRKILEKKYSFPPGGKKEKKIEFITKNGQNKSVTLDKKGKLSHKGRETLCQGREFRLGRRDAFQKECARAPDYSLGNLPPPTNKCLNESKSLAVLRPRVSVL